MSDTTSTFYPFANTHFVVVTWIPTANARDPRCVSGHKPPPIGDLINTWWVIYLSKGLFGMIVSLGFKDTQT